MRGEVIHGFKKIVVGVDFAGAELTLGSRAAAQRGLWLARRTGASLDFLHSTRRDVEDGQRDDASEEARRATLAVLTGEQGAGVATPELHFTEERAWLALTRRVLSGKSDLVIVAKRNHSERDDRKLGSVALKLVRKCPSPVWVVKPENELDQRCVVAATDLSPVGDLAVEYGAFVARAEGCRLCVVHAWQVSMELQLESARMKPDEAAAERRAIETAAREHIQRHPAVVGLEQAVQIYLACGTPSRTILEFARSEDPDLVVMGTVSRGGIAGLLVGNTAEKLLQQLDCSLLTVKPDSFVSPVS